MYLSSLLLSFIKNDGKYFLKENKAINREVEGKASPHTLFESIFRIGEGDRSLMGKREAM